MTFGVKKCIGGFKILSVRFLEDIGLEDIVLKEINQVALVSSPILDRVLERILPSEEELFYSLSQNDCEGHIEVMEKPILYCDDAIELMTKVCLKMRNGGYFVWKPQHRLWEVVFTMSILDKQKGTWMTAAMQPSLQVESTEDFFLVPFHMAFKMDSKTPFSLVDENVKQLCKTIDTLYDWTRTKEKGVQTMVLVGVGAYSKLATGIISYYESKRCSAVINSFTLKQCQSKNFALTGVSSFFEKVEQLKKCHGCLLILDQPTTWFEIDATQNLAHCAEILQRFTKTTGNCLILLSTQELPECLDHMTHIVLNAQGKITKHCSVQNVLDQVNAWFETKTQTLPTMLSNLEKAVVQRELDPSKISTEYFDYVLTCFPSAVPCQKNEFKKFLSCVFKSPLKNYSPRFLLKADHGNGKTALCHSLKTLEGLTVVPIVMSDVIFSAFGLSQNYLKHLFGIAKKSIPSILLVEDIENFTRHSSNDTCKWGEELVGYLCTLIDSLPGTIVYEGNPTVGIMITTR